MCQLFGVSAAEPLEVNAYLAALASNSTEHPHGWGIAQFRRGSVNVEKEPAPAWQSQYLQSRLKFPLKASCLIAHIRRASVGDMSYENCHPFTWADSSGRSWTLAHNGTIFSCPLLEAYRAAQEGGTDSERILLHLVQRMNEALAQKRRELTAWERFRVAERSILEVAEHNMVNLMFFDGEALYVHANRTDRMYYRREGDALLLATAALDQKPWEPLPLVRLFSFRSGAPQFEGEPHPWEYTQEEDRVRPYDSAFL